MLVIRMQRTGRKGHAQFRVVVQDSRRTPTSGKVVAALGSYNPHSKETKIDKEKAQFYLDHGAQPSPRVVRLLKAEKIKLPKWVKEDTKGERKTRNPEKRRSTAPAEPVDEETSVEKDSDTSTDAPAKDTSIEEKPAEETAEESSDKQ